MMKRLIEIWKKWFGKSSECVSQNLSVCVSRIPDTSQEEKAVKRKSISRKTKCVTFSKRNVI